MPKKNESHEMSLAATGRIAVLRKISELPQHNDQVIAAKPQFVFAVKQAAITPRVRPWLFPSDISESDPNMLGELRL
jgi:hypothetical protein